MKIRKIKLMMLMALVLLCSDAMAGEPGVTFLFTNGKKASFAFASKPEIAVGNDGITISSSNSNPVSYTFSDVQRFYFEDDIETGIQQVECSASANQPVFRYVDGVVTVSGMSAGERLAVVTLDGSQVDATKADAEGNALIGLGSAPAGVYVVSTGSGVSFKLLKK
jgi:hypothetical protein